MSPFLAIVTTHKLEILHRVNLNRWSVSVKKRVTKIIFIVRDNSWPWDTFPDACPSYQARPWVADTGNPTIYSGQLRNKHDFPDE
jgi:hypothetical protein